MLVYVRPSNEALLRARVPGARRPTWVPFLLSLPLDAATDTSPLVAVDRISGEGGIDRGTQVAAGDGLVAAGSALVELSAVDQPPFAVEEIEVRSAGRPIGFRDVLGFVKTEGEGEAEALGHLFQSRRGVVRILHRIVAADADDAKPCACVVPPDLRNLLLDVHHIGAVTAHEHDQQGGLAGE